MEHNLDNPAWNALISGNSNLAFGDDQVRYFDKDVSPFAAFAEYSGKNFAQLFEITPPDSYTLFVSPTEISIPSPWTLLHTIHGLQMVYNGSAMPKEQHSVLLPLGEEHIAQMIELTKLTNPGPFAQRTIDFGHYRGIFQDGQLVAMAGQRLHPFNYAEVSAVCTRPGYTGRGYARQLLLQQVSRILSAGEIPFLHVKHDNYRAIKVYKGIGFEPRIEVWFYVMAKKQ